MADEILKRDENHVPVLGGITDNAAQEIRMLRVDPTTGRLMVSISGVSVAATITVGTTTTLAPGASATVTNVGDQFAAIFDFGIPEGLKGDTGDAATIAVGTVTTVAAGTPATVTNVGTSGAAIFDFEIPQGLDITWRGTYDGGTTYSINDAVAYLGTSYIWINATPASGQTPADDIYWDILALKGTDGTGAGDVSGPVSSTGDNFASFADSTGKLIKDSGYKASDFASSSITQYTDEMAQDAVGNAVGNGLDYDDGTGAISVDETELTLYTTVQGKQIYHGIQQHGAVTWNNTTHIVTLAAGTNTYWFQGTKYTTASAITCDLDDYVVLGATPTLYYVSFDDASGTLKASASPWDWYANVFVATVFWNGTTGAVQEETHVYNRDIPMHIWAHSTIGTRYQDGLNQTAPTTAADSTLQIETGTIWDEDHSYATGQRTNMRGWFKYDATHYTFLDYGTPYLGGGVGDPYWLDTDDYTLKAVPDNDFVCYWVYACTDIDRPIYVIPTQASTTYATIALARAEIAPAVSGVNINNEVKLLYRWIYKGDGQYQEGADYRTTTSLAGGVSAATSAGSVSFAPAGNISSSTVQGAIEELDNEKAPLRPAVEKITLIDADEVTGNDSANSFSQIRTTWTNVKVFLKTYFDTLYQTILVSGTNIKTINSTTLLGSGDIAITPNATHTGEVTGATGLTVDKTAITNKTEVTAEATDYVLISDTSDSGNLKKALLSVGGSIDYALEEDINGDLQPITGTPNEDEFELDVNDDIQPKVYDYSDVGGNVMVGNDPWDLPNSSLITCTASENLTAGTPVGITNFANRYISKSRLYLKTALHRVPNAASNATFFQQTACPVGGDKFVFMIRSTDNSDTLYMQVGEVNRDTNTITLGNPAIVATAITPMTSGYGTCCKLDTDKFIVFYLTDASTTIVKYRVGTVAGNGITFGAEATASTAGSTLATSTSWSSDYLSTDKGIFCYKAATETNSKMICFTVSGTTATFGGEVTPGANSRNNIISYLTRLDTDKYVLVTFKGADSIASQVCTVSGVTITAGTELLYTPTTVISASLGTTSVVSFDTDKYMVKVRGINANGVFIMAFSVSGTTPTPSNEIAYDSTNNGALGTLILQDSTNVISLALASSLKITISGNTLSSSFAGGTVAETYQAINLDNGYAVSAYNSATVFTYWVQGMSNNFSGIVQSNVARGQTADVLVRGIDNNQTGLVAGSLYDTINGVLTGTDLTTTASTLGTQINIVKSISDTQIIV